MHATRTQFLSSRARVRIPVKGKLRYTGLSFFRLAVLAAFFVRFSRPSGLTS